MKNRLILSSHYDRCGLERAKAAYSGQREDSTQGLPDSQLSHGTPEEMPHFSLLLLQQLSVRQTDGISVPAISACLSVRRLHYIAQGFRVTRLPYKVARTQVTLYTNMQMVTS